MKTDIKIYLATCDVTGKKYIGITTKTLKRRWIQHRSAAKQKTGFIFHKAISCYGPDAFHIEQLASAFTWEDACELEKFFIAEHQTCHPFGYNVHTGGNGLDIIRLKEKVTAAHRGKKHSETTKLKMRMIHQEKLRDPDYRRKLSEGAKKRVWTDEDRKQHAELVRARCIGKKQHPDVVAKRVIGIRLAAANRQQARFLALSSAALFRNYLNQAA